MERYRERVKEIALPEPMKGTMIRIKLHKGEIREE